MHKLCVVQTNLVNKLEVIISEGLMMMIIDDNFIKSHYKASSGD